MRTEYTPGDGGPKSMGCPSRIPSALKLPVPRACVGSGRLLSGPASSSSTSRLARLTMRGASTSSSTAYSSGCGNSAPGGDDCDEDSALGGAPTEAESRCSSLARCACCWRSACLALEICARRPPRKKGRERNEPRVSSCAGGGRRTAGA